ncbi:TKL family protein kinase [Trichomonas vaginalis G3]|uniref:TKL family protein kinase n=1 Tax=Trichomonas vaginalis (strain ATCC PRA-98 / G3) TaxID=412133 RepID=A2DKS0_TRIV3|nr:ERAD pathway [Trichomonas vaginalis G3]EAY19053.1 TKL family protein kinase [Trichomonas vaginalis G3]KAI5521142.1 ERAD pathway [Trichomonas vaginalis G3]|eukprot:XP_001580039.1 TKL family protein kinase [Trichomonas vaginalis G3]
MGGDLSVVGENPSTQPAPLINYIQPIETYDPREVIFDSPLGNITLMINENENDFKYFVKTLNIDLSQTQNASRFFKEVQNLSLSYFPTILPFAGFTISNPHNGRKPAVAFDHYSGQKLSEILELETKNQSPETWDLTMKIRTSLGVALALNYMHGYRCPHGNLNADNVVFGDDFWPYLTDFSLNNFYDENTIKNLVPGENHPIWKAPELEGETAKTQKGDVYSFGMLVFQLFIGKTQFDIISNTPDIYQKLKSSTRPKIPDNVPLEIKNIIQSCWAPNPNDRPTMSNVIKLFEESIGAIPNINLSLLEKFRERIKAENSDISKAHTALTVAQSGDASAQNNFGVMLLNGKGVHKNLGAAARYFQLSADQGSMEGMHNIGFALENGAGVKKNLPLAILYYKAAADKGSKAAQNSYAQCLMKGNGIEKNILEAAKYFRMAAQQNSAPAQYRLGYLHETGEGAAMNYNEALRYYKAASIQKYPPAMYRFGLMILNEKVTGQNVAEARKSIMTAAQMGHAKSCCLHGSACITGDGVTKNVDFARKMFEKAITKKEPAGYFGLSVLCLLDGKIEEARKNMRLSALGGYCDAIKVWLNVSEDEAEKQKLNEELQKIGDIKDSVVPIPSVFKGSSITPTIEGVANALNVK